MACPARAGGVVLVGGLACVLALAAAAQGHHHQGGGAGGDAAGLSAAPAALVRTLEDETRPSAPGRIAWSTHWKLCWAEVAGALRYEVRLVTSEGAPRTPTLWFATCYRVEVAAGENAAEQGMPQRTLMLAMQSAQAALQVRAVFADGRRSAWTAEQPVGEVPSATPAP